MKNFSLIALLALLITAPVQAAWQFGLGAEYTIFLVWNLKKAVLDQSNTGKPVCET